MQNVRPRKHFGQGICSYSTLPPQEGDRPMKYWIRIWTFIECSDSEIYTCLALRSNTTYCWHWSSLLFLIVQKWRTLFSLWSSSFKISEENKWLATGVSSRKYLKSVLHYQKENCCSPGIKVAVRIWRKIMHKQHWILISTCQGTVK